METDRCLICGKRERLTDHHVPYEIGTLRLCRNCHDIVEEAKVYVNQMKSLKSAFKRGYDRAIEDLIKISRINTDNEDIDFKLKVYQWNVLKTGFNKSAKLECATK
jgi:ribosome-binding protein aMBF1 (putative translation factor)